MHGAIRVKVRSQKPPYNSLQEVTTPTLKFSLQQIMFNLQRLLLKSITGFTSFVSSTRFNVILRSHFYLIDI